MEAKQFPGAWALTFYHHSSVTLALDIIDKKSSAKQATSAKVKLA
jgi:hypothetical protein